MKLKWIALVCLLALPGCSNSSDGGAPGPSAYPAAEGGGTGRCASMYGRPSPFISCRQE